MGKVPDRNLHLLLYGGQEWAFVINLKCKDPMLVGEAERRGEDGRVGGVRDCPQGEALEG